MRLPVAFASRNSFLPRLVGVEALVPVVGFVGHVAFHATNSVFQGIEFRFELSQSNFS
jgi:hypothetical protein